MKTFLIIGHTGRGKSTKVKEILAGLYCDKLIYDVNNEHNTGKPLPGIGDFLTLAKKKVNTAIVFEEATIFFSNRGRSEEVIDLLVRKRHTNNIIILLFHSIRSVPNYIFELIDYIILFKTNDNEKLIHDKFKDNEQLIEFYNAVNQSDNFFEHKLFKNS